MSQVNSPTVRETTELMATVLARRNQAVLDGNAELTTEWTEVMEVLREMLAGERLREARALRRQRGAGRD